MYYVYILTNKTDTVMYIGVTNDLRRRLYEHKSEQIEGFTKKYHVHKLVYFEEYSDVTDAIAREKQLKRWVRAKKNWLVETKNPNWNDWGLPLKTHNMKLNPSPFEMIKSGEKTIELRLFDEKRRQVKEGDRIVFTDTTTGETLNTTVVKLHRFDSFKELYKSLPLLKFGYTTEDINDAQPADMEQYYSVEEQKKYGVVGIEICLPE